MSDHGLDSKKHTTNVQVRQESSTANDTLSFVVGRNKNVTNEEFDMRDKTKDREAAEVWSILKLLMADEPNNAMGQGPFVAFR